MKQLCVGILVCIVLYSCKKDSKDLSNPSDSVNGHKYSITFDLKDFSPQILGVKERQIAEAPPE